MQMIMGVVIPKLPFANISNIHGTNMAPRVNQSIKLIPTIDIEKQLDDYPNSSC